MQKNGRSVIIDAFPEAAEKYPSGTAIVCVDVIRATTTAVTAVNRGRRCFPVESADEAYGLAAKLHGAVLVGELGGEMPPGFDMNNSPAQIDRRTDVRRPAILLSSSGSRLLVRAAARGDAFAACFRNRTAAAEALIDAYETIAVIGAGSRGEFREEDEICCSWIAGILADAGYTPADRQTLSAICRWNGMPAEACLISSSIDYLRRSGQEEDLDFILDHIDDLPGAYRMSNGEVVPAAEWVYVTRDRR